MEEKKTSQEKAPWITYRPELKVLDCTVRDGGLINDHQFNDDFVRAVYDTCLAAGLDTMEIGYGTSSARGAIAGKTTSVASSANMTPRARA